MKSGVSIEKVVKALRGLGFQARKGKGNGRGHHVPFVDLQGRKVEVWMGSDQLAHGHLIPLMDQLYSQRGIDRRTFREMIRAA